MKAHPSIWFSVILACLFGCFLISLWHNPEAQSPLFFRQTADYRADYRNVLKYAGNNDPYFHDTPAPYSSSARAERVAPPFVFMIAYQIDKLLHKAKSLPPDFYHLVESLWMLYCVLFLFAGLSGGCKAPYAHFLVFTLFLSSIFMFALERGNIILLSAGCTTFFIFNYNHKNKWIREFSFLALACAAAIKMTPAVLGLLLLEERRYKEAVRLVIYGILFFFLPFLTVQGGFGILPTWLSYLRLNTIVYDWIPIVRFNFRYWLSGVDTGWWVYHVFYFCGTIVGLSIAIVALFTNRLLAHQWQRVLQLVLLFAVLPSNSGEYTALYLFAPIVLFFNQSSFDKRDIFFFICFILVLNPFYIPGFTPGAMNLAASAMLLVLTFQSGKQSGTPAVTALK